MSKRPLTLLRNLALLLPLFLYSDRIDSFEELLAALEKQTYDYVQEKVYLHMDKPYYSQGDNLWFKAYTVAGPNHTPTPLSENLYVELVGPQSKVLKRLTIYLDKGMGYGDFWLADSLQAGNYAVRAYTNWMRNFDEAFFFRKSVRLINPLAPESNDAEEVTNIDVGFYPEGGELIAGVTSQVAIELVGLNESLPGEIVDENDDVVATFQTQHQGMAKFTLNPEAGKSYYAKIDGRAKKYELPQVQTSGLILSVDNVGDSDNMLVNITSSNTGNNQAYLIAHTRGLVGFASKLEWKGASARIKIPKSDLNPGVVQLTLFNENWLPEAERLAFQRPAGDLFDIELSTNQPSYQPRDSTMVKLKVQTKDGQPVQGFFSINVYDAKQISPSDYEEHIASSLLLSSDIKGIIRNPKQYFNSENPNADAHLDLLLMTKGWRRFTWKDLLNNQFPETEHSVEQGFDVSGTVQQRGGKKMIAKGKVKQIGNFNGLPTLAEATTNNKGEFEMKNLLYYEEVSLIQAEDKKGKNNVVLTINPMDIPTLPGTVKLPESLGNNKLSVEEDFLTRSRERMNIDSVYSFENMTDLGTVIVEGTRNSQIFSNASRGLIFNRGEYSLNVSDIMSNGQRFQNALYILQGRVPGVNIVLGPTAGEPLVQMNRKVWSIQNPDPPIFYVIDDLPVDISAVTALQAEQVQRVEVMKGMRATGIYGPAANGGAIVFYTKTQTEMTDFYKKLAENGITTTKNTAGLAGGFYSSRQFYAPKYSVELPEHIKPDRRDLIHWEPMIQTDANGEATVTFYNADLETDIQVNLEGIWEGGLPITASTQYKVKDN